LIGKTATILSKAFFKRQFDAKKLPFHHPIDTISGA